MPSRPPSFKSPIKSPPGDYAQTRADRQPWQRNYTSRRWRTIREQQLRNSPLCAECLRANPPRVTAANVVHHVEQHHGEDEAFWNGPLESVCKSCHDREIQSRERTDSVNRSGAELSRPGWLTKATIPMTIVCGPPGAGKSTYVRKHAHPHDRIICFDQIAKELFPPIKGGVGTRPELSGTLIRDILRKRNQAIAECTTPHAPTLWHGAWVILVEPRGQHRMWWHTTLGARVVVLPTPPSLCMVRCELDTLAGDRRRGDAIRYIGTWWSMYTRAPCDVVGQWV